MRISVFAALMAAASLVPGVAMAQRSSDDRGNRPRGATIESRIAVEPDRPNRGARPDRPQPAQLADRGGGPRAGERGNDGNRGGGIDRPIPPTAPVAQSGRGLRSVFRDNDGRGGARAGRGDNGQWRGNANQRGNEQLRGNDARGGGNGWRGNDGPGNHVRGDQWRGKDRRQDARGDRGSWNRGWRQDNRYDWNRRRQYDRNAFHLPRYYAPSGWNYGYRRFTIGITLKAGLFNRTYWIDDADYYGLPEAYGPYRWVRYYNDALLVDVYSGQVVDTVYDIFW